MSSGRRVFLPSSSEHRSSVHSGLHNNRKEDVGILQRNQNTAMTNRMGGQEENRCRNSDSNRKRSFGQSSLYRNNRREENQSKRSRIQYDTRYEIEDNNRYPRESLENEATRRDNRKGKSRFLGYRKLKELSEVKEPNDLLIQVIGCKEELTSLMKNKENFEKDDWIDCILLIFSKCASATRVYKPPVFSIICDTEYLYKIHSKLLQWSCLEKPTNHQTAHHLINIACEIMKIYETNATELPLEDIKQFVTNAGQHENQLEMVNELISKRKEIVLNKQQSNQNQQVGLATFREASILPTPNDIHGTQRNPDIRPIKTLGSYTSDEEYLEIHFRLLQEDLVSPLRQGIKELEKPKRDRKNRLNTYHGVKIAGRNYTNYGITNDVYFDVRNMKRVVWKYSKKLMTHNLLCLSKDGFQTMIFAYIARRDIEKLSKGCIEVRFTNVVKSEEYGKDRVEMSMVESSVYFEAYRHILYGLQEIRRVPFSNYIVKGQNLIQPPSYLKYNGIPLYDLNDSLQMSHQKIEFLEDNRWPSFQDTCLNESQYEAFKTAITNEFVLIQGPPGTGKTYVGLKIADALLCNKSYWNRNQSPLLVVCYTNHALDQFLKGLLDFGHKQLIRIGGKVSDELRRFSLFEARKSAEAQYLGNIAHGRRRNRRTAQWNIRGELKRQAIELQEQSTSEELNEKVAQGTFINSFQYQNMMTEPQFQYFQEFEGTFQNLDLSQLVVFLELCSFTYADIEKLALEFEDDKNKVDVMDIDITEKMTLFDLEEGEIRDDVLDEDAFQPVVENYSLNSIPLRYTREQITDLRYHLNTIKRYQKTKGLSPRGREDIIERKLNEVTAMKEETALEVSNPWKLRIHRKWQLYKYWLSNKRGLKDRIKLQQYETSCAQMQEIEQIRDEEIIKKSDIVAMTTTGAAKYRKILNNIKPKVVIVEEAAEVLESHVVTALTEYTEHVILIGDHKQLKPKPSVYKLAKDYHLDLSLFERMINNGIKHHTLDTQHRMRPEISSLLKHIYPQLQDHASVKAYPNVKGMTKNMFFLNHEEKENENEMINSKSNEHEAHFLKSFSLYLLQQGYKTSQITVITGYAGQVMLLKKLMPRDIYEGIKITSIDNFQGEENDIILLSLVRSNDEGTVGFMKNENRVCVCLSRAKIGLYVMGNFQLFATQQDETWKKILADVKQMGCYGDKLMLQCQHHPATKTEVKTELDFNKVPEGGCNEKCDFRLDCGHSCQRRCHSTDTDHKRYKCQFICDTNRCSNEQHLCERICHFNTKCDPCPIKVKKLIQSCQHIQEMKCSIEPDCYSCLAACDKVLSCGHRCHLECWKSCSIEKCIELVEKTLACTHEITTQCNRIIENIDCKEMVMKELLCGHNLLMECCKPIGDAYCRGLCGEVLACSHVCTGSCGRCKQKRLHVQCQAKCERILVCSHLCNAPCTKDCPPCDKYCLNTCPHSRCRHKCGKICIPCREPCKWKCKHLVCSKKCFEVCDMKRCNEPCKRKLPCEHSCIGLCGERCPKLCRQCDKEQVEEIFFGTEDEPDARFIQLLDCEHFFEVTSLDHWMDINEDNSVKLKDCPKCKTVIRKSFRYGNVIKRAVNDIDQVKKVILGEPENIQKTRIDIFMLWQQIVEKIKIMAVGNVSQISLEICSSCNRTLHNVRAHTFMTQTSQQNGTSFNYKTSFKFKNHCITHQLFKDISEANSVGELNHLKNRTILFQRFVELVMSLGNVTLTGKSIFKCLNVVKKFIFYVQNEQQFSDAAREISRLQLYWNVMTVKKELDETRTTEKEKEEILQKNQNKVNKYLLSLEHGIKIDEDEIQLQTEDLKQIAKENKLNAVLTDTERLMIVRVMGLKKGAWYKCPNGHVYAIGECGGAMQTLVCPECKELIGGGSHRLVEGNQHAGEFDGSSRAAWPGTDNMRDYRF